MLLALEFSLFGSLIVDACLQGNHLGYRKLHKNFETIAEGNDYQVERPSRSTRMGSGKKAALIVAAVVSYGAICLFFNAFMRGNYAVDKKIMTLATFDQNQHIYAKNSVSNSSSRETCCGVWNRADVEPCYPTDKFRSLYPDVHPEFVLQSQLEYGTPNFYLSVATWPFAYFFFRVLVNYLGFM
jgi:hypothetical protein